MTDKKSLWCRIGLHAWNYFTVSSRASDPSFGQRRECTRCEEREALVMGFWCPSSRFMDMTVDEQIAAYPPKEQP